MTIKPVRRPRPATLALGTAQPFGAAYGLDNSAIEKSNEELVRDFTDTVFVRHEIDRIDEFLRDDFLQHSPTFGPGVEGFREFAGFLGQFPDLEATYELTFPQNNRVFALIAWRGTHAESGRKLIWHSCHIYRVEDDKLAEHWSLVDHYGLERFGREAPPDQHQPASPIDWFGNESQRANLDLFLRFANAMFVERRKEDAGDFLCEDFVNNDPLTKFGGQLMSGNGIEGFQHCFIWYHWVPDMSFTLDQVISGNGHVGAFWSSYGVNSYSGEAFLLHTVDVYRVKEGKIAEHWTLWDFSQLKSLGLIPPEH